MTAAYSFSPYGERTTRFGSTTFMTAFMGHFYLKPSSATHRAARQLSLAWFRAYDPVLGVWFNRDPLGEVSDAVAELLPEGPNLYALVRNNVVNRADNLGLHDGYPEPVGRDGITGNRVFIGKDKKTLYAIDSRTLRRVPLGMVDTATPTTPTRCPMREPKGDANWRPRRVLLVNLVNEPFIPTSIATARLSLGIPHSVVMIAWATFGKATLILLIQIFISGST